MDAEQILAFQTSDFEIGKMVIIRPEKYESYADFQLDLAEMEDGQVNWKVSEFISNIRIDETTVYVLKFQLTPWVGEVLDIGAPGTHESTL